MNVLFVVLMVIARSNPILKLPLRAGNWRDVPEIGESPQERFGHYIHRIDNGIILYSGISREQSLLHDVWLFNTTWQVMFSSRNPTPRTGASTWGLGTNLYLFGGRLEISYFEDMWMYSTDLEDWVSIKSNGPIPEGRSDSSTFKLTMNNTSEPLLCLHGGRTSHGMISDLWCFNATESTWERLCETGPSRTSHGILVSSSELLLIGGRGSGGGGDQIYTLNITNYITGNATNLTWEISEKRTPVRKDSTFTQINDVLVEVGGVFENKMQSNIRIYTSNGDMKTIKTEESISAAGVAEYIDNSDSKVIKLFIFGGQRVSGLQTTLLILGIDINNHNSVAKVITRQSHRHMPVSRALHSASSVGHKLVVFGGVSGGVLLGDLWTLNTETEQWEELSAFGSLSPSPRHSHRATSIGSIVSMFGGVVASGQPTDELWLLDVSTKMWEIKTSNTATGQLPKARSSHVQVSDLNGLLIYGGESHGSVLSDVWRYDFGTEKWIQLLQVGTKPGFLSRSAVGLPYSVDKLFYISGGLDNTGVPTDRIYQGKYNKTTLNWSFIARFHSSLSDHAMAVVGIGDGCSDRKLPQLIIVGGLSYNSLHTSGGKMAYITSHCNETITTYEVIRGNLTTFAGWFYGRMGHTLSLFGDSLYLYGGYGISQTREWHVDHTLSHVSLHRLGVDSSCSPGYYIDVNTKNCTICPAGHISTEWGSHSCSPCQAGTYQPIQGGSSKRACLLCPLGTFGPEPGRYACEVCHPYHFCGHGATVPVVMSTEISAFSSVQPFKLSGTHQELDIRDLELLRDWTWIITTLVIASLIVGFTLSKTEIFATDVIQSFDVFFSIRGGVKVYNYGGRIQQIKHTPLGGLFSLIFVCFIIAFIVSVSIFPYLYNDSTTTRMMPKYLAQYYSSVHHSSSLDLLLTAEISDPLRLCNQSTIAQKCPTEFVFNTTGISKKEIDGDHILDSYCEAVLPDKCKVSITLQHATMISVESTVQLKIALPEMYATTINWSASVSSGANTGKDSFTRGEAVPDPNMVFKGASDPLTIHLEVFPIIFSTDTGFDRRTKQGSLISYNYLIKGGQGSVKNIQFKEGFSIAFLLKESHGIHRHAFQFHEGVYFVAMALSCTSGVYALLHVLYSVVVRVTETKHPDAPAIVHLEPLVKERVKEWEYVNLLETGTAEELQQFEETMREDILDDRYLRDRGQEYYNSTAWRNTHRQKLFSKYQQYMSAAGRPVSDTTTITGEQAAVMMKVPPSNLLVDALTGKPFDNKNQSELSSHDWIMHCPEVRYDMGDITVSSEVRITEDLSQLETDCLKFGVIFDPSVAGLPGVVVALASGSSRSEVVLCNRSIWIPTTSLTTRRQDTNNNNQPRPSITGKSSHCDDDDDDDGDDDESDYYR